MNDPGGMLYTQQHQLCCYSDQSDKQLAVVTAEGSKILEGTVDNELNWWILQAVETQGKKITKLQQIVLQYITSNNTQHTITEDFQ